MKDLKTFELIHRHLISYLFKYEDAQCASDAALNTALALSIILLPEEKQKELLEESDEACTVLLLEGIHLKLLHKEFLEKPYVKKALEKAERLLDI